MLHKNFPSQLIWEVFFHAQISSQPLFHLKNPAMQDFYRIFNQDCELVSQLPIVFIVWSTTKIRLMVFGYICNGSFHGDAHTWWLPLRRCTVPESFWRMFCNFLQFGDATFSNSRLQLSVILLYNKHLKYEVTENQGFPGFSYAQNR